MTSKIRSAEGRRVTTKSGSVYDLGEPDPEYLKFLSDIGRAYDVAQPVKVLSAKAKDATPAR